VIELAGHATPGRNENPAKKRLIAINKWCRNAGKLWGSINVGSSSGAKKEQVFGAALRYVTL